MVAMVIGMLGLLVMMQMFAMFEGQKRTTTGGDDAISAGAVSLYGLQRNIQHSGFGSNSLPIIGCSVSGLLVGGAAMPLAPVTIYRSLGATINTPAGYPAIPDPDPNTDVLLIFSGNGRGTVEGDNIDAPGATTYAVHTPTSFSLMDKVVSVPQIRPVNCGGLVVTTITAVANPTITVAAAAGYAVAVDDKLFNLGAKPSVNAYAVRGQNLTVCDYADKDCTNLANWVAIASGVVSLRVQYGRDTTAAPMDAIVDAWDQTGPVTACEFIRASAVRVALIARNSQPEKTLDWPAQTIHVWPVAPLWIGSDASAVLVDAAQAAAVAVNLTDAGLSPGGGSWPTWQDFRYKVFQTTVSLRNITILGALPEC